MIRKSIIVVLTAGAAGAGVVWLAHSCGMQSWAISWTIFERGPTTLQVRIGSTGLSIARLDHVLSPVPLRMDASLGGPSYSITATPKIVEMRVNIPHLVLMPFFAAYPLIAFIRGPLRRWRRRRRGLCIRCGYNLEGNVSGTCPECGEGTP